MRTRILTAALAAACLILTGCGGESSADQQSAAATTTAPPDSKAACVDAGKIVVDAHIPTDNMFVADQAALEVRAAAEEAAGKLGELEADGAVASGISAVAEEMTAIGSFPVGEPMSWATYRKPLTAAVTALQGACATAGVSDFLNP